METKNIKNIYFIGIGGVGMSSLARIVQSRDCKISGSDIMENEYTQDLRKVGISINIGHCSKNINKDIQLIVYSSAIPPDNVELKRAGELNIPVLKRANFLSLIFNNKKGIAISGSHGKTTTTAILAYIMKSADYDITTMIGGKMFNTNSNAYIGKSEWMITEADESDCGFTKLHPFISVVTNIDDDHLNFYKSIENERKAFLSFISNTQENGYSIINADNPLALSTGKEARCNVFKYSLTNGEIYVKNIHTKNPGHIFDVYIKDKNLGTFTLNIPGIHNISNVLPAIFIAHSLGIDTRIIKRSLESFKGVKRRFTIVGREKGITVVDDYAHHPEEIKATLSATSEINNSRIVALFQPHRYTRVEGLFGKFTTAFEKANKVFITDIYSAGEKPIDGITAVELGKAINKYRDCTYVRKDNGLTNRVMEELKEGDVVITLGAGDIWKTGIDLLCKLKQQ
jgi:UDP-N-acetylmuramate--alanine ligase